MFENFDRGTDDGWTDAGDTGILLAHPFAFDSGELILVSGIMDVAFHTIFIKRIERISKIKPII